MGYDSYCNPYGVRPCAYNTSNETPDGFDALFTGESSTLAGVKALLASASDGARAHLIGQRTNKHAATYYKVGGSIFTPKLNFIPCDGTEFDFVDEGEAGEDDAAFRVYSGQIHSWMNGLRAENFLAVINALGVIGDDKTRKFRIVYSIDYTSPSANDFLILGTMVPSTDAIRRNYGAHCWRYSSPARVGVTSSTLGGGSVSQTVVQSWALPENYPREACFDMHSYDTGGVLMTRGFGVSRTGKGAASSSTGTTGSYTGVFNQIFHNGERRPYIEAIQDAGSDTLYTIHGIYMLGDIPQRSLS